MSRQLILLSVVGALSCGARTELSVPVPLLPQIDAALSTPADTIGRVVPIRLLFHGDAQFAVMSDGTVRMWGHSTIPGLIDPSRPTEVPGMRDVVAIRGGAESFEYITRSGRLFRVNDRGLSLPGMADLRFPPLRDFNRSGDFAVVAAYLGSDGVALSRLWPGDEFSTVVAPLRFRAIGGYADLVAVGEDGGLYSWNRQGPLTAVRIDAPFLVRDIRADCIVSDGGELACRGRGFGADGIPRERESVTQFTAVPGARNIVQWTMWSSFMVMLRSDGVLLRAGLLSREGCLRIPDAPEFQPSPAAIVPGLQHVVEFSVAGGDSICLLFRNHEVSCCGRVSGGSLGDGRTRESNEWISVAFE